jgi:hypothetical protein
MPNVGDLNVQVGLQLAKLESGFREMQQKFRANNAELRRESGRGADEISKEFNRVLKRKFGAGDVFKGVLQGIGIGSVEKISEFITEPLKKSAEAAKQLAEASDAATQSLEKLFAARNARLSLPKQLEIAKKAEESVIRAYDEKTKEITRLIEEQNRQAQKKYNPLNPFQTGSTVLDLSDKITKAQTEQTKLSEDQRDKQAVVDAYQSDLRKQADDETKAAHAQAYEDQKKYLEEFKKQHKEAADSEFARAHRGDDENQKGIEKTERLRRELSAETARIIKERERDALTAAQKAVEELRTSLLSLSDIAGLGGGSEKARFARRALDLADQAKRAEASGNGPLADDLMRQAKDASAKAQANSRDQRPDNTFGGTRAATDREKADEKHALDELHRQEQLNGKYSSQQVGGYQMPAEKQAARNLQEQGKVLEGINTLVGTLNDLPYKLGIA